ncbi:hypothetical protein [Methylogaea oryzae]|uniref:hypothetical protein n=1 Tax=Methylogaea oryzae TaxID=1295382 RepID=UPI0006CF7671|nr:hypothetical protein [Methylogaea oryzae]
MLDAIFLRAKKTRASLRWLLLAAAWVSVIGGDSLWAAPPACASQCTIYFYNPETNINNYVSLKASFDTYLSQFGEGYRFQPFDEKDIFESVIGSDENSIFLISSWHYRLLKHKYPLHPMLVGVSGGVASQKKILSASQKITDLEHLRGKNIAVAGSKAYSKNVLEQIFAGKPPDLLESLRLILVPKDIDALMAVGYGMAAAALTTEKSLDDLRAINRKQYDLLEPLGASRASLLTLVVTPHQRTPAVDALLDVVDRMQALAATRCTCWGWTDGNG